jgi:hypothetical protein
MPTDDATRSPRGTRDLVVNHDHITVQQLYEELGKIVEQHGDLPLWDGMGITIGHAERVTLNLRGGEEWRGVYICDR